MDRDLSIVSQTAAKVAADIIVSDLNIHDTQDLAVVFPEVHSIVFDSIMAQIADVEAQWARVAAEDPTKVVHAHFPGAVEVGGTAIPNNHPSAQVPPPVVETPPPPPQAAVPAPPAPQPQGPVCPKCGGAMWDNRASKKSPKMPDYRCKNRESCDGVIWPPRGGN